jgi:adenosylhomocysteine nucleosidase
MSSTTLFLIAAELEAHLLFGERFAARADVCVAGVGRAGDAAAADAIAAADVARVVNVGFAGGLGRAAGAGSVHVVTEWTGLERPTAAEDLVTELIRALEAAGLAPMRSTSATVDRPVADAATRSRLAGDGADVVEMEGSAWAEPALRRGLPFASVRVVSDGADLELPRMRHELLTPAGGVNWQAWWEAARRPASSLPRQYGAIVQARNEWRTAVAVLGDVGRALEALR